MKFLLDTNVVIPLEPVSGQIEATSPVATAFLRLVQLGGHQVYLHPVAHEEAARDRDSTRAAIRSVQLDKYLVLPSPPAPGIELAHIFGDPDRGSHDWGDLQHVAAVAADAVDYLVTEDGGIHRRAKRAGLEERVLYLSKALAVLRGLLPERPPAPPRAHLVNAHELPQADTIWASLRADYAGFDDWLQKCRRAHRECWVVWGRQREIAAVCIMKPENGHESGFGMDGKVLKIATFKVAVDYRGYRYGELLLKAVFGTCTTGNYDWTYVTAFERQAELICAYRSSRSAVPLDADHPFRLMPIAPERDAAGSLYFAGFGGLVKSDLVFRIDSPPSLTR